MQISAHVKDAILESYTTVQKRPATHFVWRNGVMEMVWRTNEESRNRLELPPDEHDIALAESFASYQAKRLRAPRFFTNSRINSFPSMTLTALNYSANFPTTLLICSSPTRHMATAFPIWNFQRFGTSF